MANINILHIYENEEYTGIIQDLCDNRGFEYHGFRTLNGGIDRQVIEQMDIAIIDVNEDNQLREDANRAIRLHDQEMLLLVLMTNSISNRLPVTTGFNFQIMKPITGKTIDSIIQKFLKKTIR